MLGVSLLLIFSGLLEMAFWLKPKYKVILLIINTLLFIYFTGCHLLYPLLQYLGFFRDLTAEQVARHLGKQISAISDRLINYLELENLEGYDLSLLQAELQRRENQLLSYNWKNWFPRVHLARYLYWLFIPLFIIALLKISGHYKAFTSSFERLQAVHQTFQPPPPFDLQLLSPLTASADSVYTLKVSVLGENVPEQIYFFTSENSLPLAKINDTLFFLQLSDVSKDIDFQLIASGYHFGPFHLNVVHAPSVAHYTIRLQYPDYTRFQGDTVTGSAYLKVPEGTRVDLTAFTQYTDYVKISKPIDYQFDKSILHLSFVARKSGRLEIRLFNSQTVSSVSFTLEMEVIPDRKPLLNVIQKRDSSVVNRRHFLLVSATDDYLLSRFELHYKTGKQNDYQKTIILYGINLPYLKSVLIFPVDFHLPDTLSYDYFLRIYDNKSPVPQYTDSPVFRFEPAISNPIQSERVQRNFLSHLQGNLNKFQKQNKAVNQTLQRLQTTRKPDWEIKREINSLIQNNQREKQRLQRLLDDMQRMMQKYKRKASDKPKAETIAKRMEELRKSVQNDSLSRELQKLLDQMRKMKMLDKLKEMEMQQQMQQKSLERLLELTKRFFIEEKMKMLADSINRLAERQKELAKENNPEELQQQKQLNQRTDSLSKSFKQLMNLNKELKNPMSLPDIQTEMKTARMFQKNALNLLQNSRQSNKMQNKAAEQLTKAAMILQSMMNQSAQSVEKEDLNKIKILIFNLLQISFNEEKLASITLENNYAFSRVLVEHNTMINVLQNVSDTLYAIASRQPAVSQDMFNALHAAEFHATQSVKYLQDRHTGMFKLHEQSLFEQINRLIYLLNLFLDTQQSASLSKSQGGGQGNEPQLSDRIKKQAGKISRSMQEMLKQMQQGQKPGQNNRNGQNNPKGVFSIYKEQQRLKDLLRQYESQNFSPHIRQLNERLDKLSNRLLREGINPSVYKEFLSLQYELLQLTKAAYRQKNSKQRQSRTFEEQFTIPDSIRLNLIMRYFPHLEEIKYYSLPLTPYYKEKYQNYKHQMP